MTEAIIADFIETISGLVGLTCWSVQISGVGSLANMHFGDKQRREQIMANPDFKVSVDERIYQGEVVLYLEECPWRLDGTDAVICSWMDENEPGAALHDGLNRLKDRRVTGVEVIRPAFDLVIAFDGGLTLRVFPDQADPEEGDNYAVATRDKTYILAAKSTLYIE